MEAAGSSHPKALLGQEVAGDQVVLFIPSLLLLPKEHTHWFECEKTVSGVWVNECWIQVNQNYCFIFGGIHFAVSFRPTNVSHSFLKQSVGRCPYLTFSAAQKSVCHHHLDAGPHPGRWVIDGRAGRALPSVRLQVAPWAFLGWTFQMSACDIGAEI